MSGALEEGKEAPPPGVRLMAVIRWLLVAAMAAVAVVSVHHYYTSQVVDDRVYHCPMHPEVVQHGPGECPICHMTLVLQGEEDSMPRAASDPAAVPAGLAPIELSAERIQRIGLRTAPVTSGALVPSVRAVGTVATSEAGQSQVSARFAGWIETINVKQTWQKVAQGDVLATIYSPDLVGAQQEYLNALTWADAPKMPSLDRAPPAHDGGNNGGGGAPAGNRLADAARAKLELLGLTRADLARLEKTRTPLRALELRAPSSGYVTQRNAVRGSRVEAGATLFEIANLSTVWVQADVYERDLARVAVGQAARFTVAAYPERAWTGTVDFLAPVIDASTRTLRVRLVFANDDLQLKPGMYGDVGIELPPQQGLLVPREAVIDTGDTQYVFLAGDGGHFEPRTVRVGARVGDSVELLAGVAAGDQVVTSAAFLLDSESRLRATRAAKTGAGAAP